jgi:hypothetical protein
VKGFSHVEIPGTRRLVKAAAFLFAACSCLLLRAMTLDLYDLDSMVHLSTDVVEGEISRSYTAHDLELVEFKVTLSHKGSVKPGECVAVAETDFYRKPDANDMNPKCLAIGDRLALFLVRRKPDLFTRIPEKAVIYMPLPGGVRLLAGDQFLAFSQPMNPGPYEACMPPADAQPKALTVAQFRGSVRDSLRHTQALARLVDATEENLDVPRLLQLLADRSELTEGTRDYFTERICRRLANRHDPALLSRALPLAKTYNKMMILNHGFGTPQGRDYLLAKVLDETEPLPVRLRHANALFQADDVYRTTLTISSNSLETVGEADAGNSGYLTRIAKAACATEKHEELSGTLIRCLDYFGRGIVQNKPAPLMVDLRDAFAVLKDFYETKPTEELQFAIEQATAIDRGAYEKLKAPCGTFISILRPVDTNHYARPGPRSLFFEYEYASLSDRENRAQLAVVLSNQQTHKKVVLQTPLQVVGRSGCSGSNSVVLPTDLPAGRYRVFLQLGEGDKVISTGHFFSADL